MIRSRLLSMPVLLAFLLMVGGLAWTPLDQQYVMDFNLATDAGPTILGGKIAVAAIFVLLAAFWRPEDNPWPRLGPVPTILLAIAALSTIWSFDIPTTLFFLLQLLATFGTAMIAARLLGLQTTLRIVFGFLSVVIVASVALAAVGDRHALMGGQHVGLWRGLFPHKNQFGPFIVVNLAIALLGRQAIAMPRALQLGMIAIDAVALFFAHSNTAILAALAVVVLWLLLLPIANASLRAVWRTAMVAALIALGVALFLNAEVIAGLMGRDLTLTNRTRMWSAAVDLTFDNPVGTGFGTSGGTQASVEIQKVTHTERSQSVQSGYINMALELGWAPVALLVGWLLFVLARIVADNRRDDGQALLAGLVALHLLTSISEVGGGIAPRLTLFLILLLVAHSRATPVLSLPAPRPPGRRPRLAIAG